MGVRQCLVAARFVIEAAPIPLAHVGLVAGHFKHRVFHSLAADLNTTIDETCAGQFDLKPQIEILELPRRAEEFVMGHGLAQIPTDQCALLDAPRPSRISLPAIETSAIEKPSPLARLRRRFVFGRISERSRAQKLGVKFELDTSLGDGWILVQFRLYLRLIGGIKH